VSCKNEPAPVYHCAASEQWRTMPTLAVALKIRNVLKAACPNLPVLNPQNNLVDWIECDQCGPLAPRKSFDILALYKSDYYYYYYY